MKAGNLRISGFHFSRERVVAGSGILQRRLPAEAFAQQTEHKLARTARRASDSKSAEHKKSFSGAAWIFCMEPNSFGVTRGEQPLVCNGDDRGQRPKQGGAVGAAACRMRVPRKARSRRREPQPAASRASKVAETLPR